MNEKISSLILLGAALLAGPAAGQHGVTVLRGESGEQPRQAAPDTGVRRVPSGTPTGTPPATPAPTARPAPLEASQPIAGDGRGNGVLPPPASSTELSQALGSAKTLSAGEAAALGVAFKAVDDGRYGDARAAVANFNNPLLSRIVQWTVMRVPRSDATFAATWKFLRDSPDWPEPEVLRRQAEDRISPTTPPQEVFRYFTAFPPLTSTGHMRRLEAAGVASLPDVPRLARDSWRNATFRASDEKDFLEKYGGNLTGDDHIARFDRIMRSGRIQAATDLLPKLPPEYKPVAEARLAMATKAADAPTVLRGVPAARLAEPTIRLEQLAWLRRTGKLDDARTLALQATDANQADAWWNERHQLARDLLAAGRPADAYAVTVPHGQTKGVAFVEAEFLAGWIALRHLRRTADAQKHFQTLYDGVSTDHMKSRGAYWLGRTHEAAGRSKDAQDWFTRAAAFGQTFYGQQAARKLPGGARQMPSEPVASNTDQQALGGRELVTVARFIGQSGDYERTRPFLLQLARFVTTPGETMLLAQLASDLKRPDVALVIARRAQDSNIHLSDAAFPVIDLGSTGSIERALALALTRQESGFNAAAVSSSGALGLMQLLPTTAQEVAGKLSLPFVQDKLTRDPAYNVTLGSAYLALMLQRFGGSYELSLAAYNAGPGRVSGWLKSMGDPRAGKIDMVDWIEMIPFRETRGYVQRVMEGVGVYRERLNGPFRLQAPATGRS